ncbi:hypothetical protein MMC16_003828 [Acarospora aff. strigata]|nr:hypothetical protein [Acarospora aff. strigata]
MATRLSWLPSLKLAQLKHVAVATGINSSGTKTDLSSRLLGELQHVQKSSTQGQRIISIDMGIRNLAYCVLAVDTPLPHPTASTELSRRQQRSRDTLPILEGWTRVAVSSKVQPDTTTGDPSPKTKPKIKEAFDPATYARHATTLVSHLLRTHRPSTILIERQRYRSMGHSAVQEWTLRVNMFEAMIHAVLETLFREGRWSGAVHAVSPSKVGPFWLGGEGTAKAKAKAKVQDAASKKKKDSKKGTNKSAKIDLVGTWLEEGREVEMAPGAENTRSVFLGKWKGKKSRKKKKEADVDIDIGKLDDLADCLMQGTAWLKWQENKRKLVEGGPDTLA